MASLGLALNADHLISFGRMPEWFTGVETEGGRQGGTKKLQKIRKNQFLLNFFLVFLWFSWFFYGFPKGFLLEISPLVSPDRFFGHRVPKILWFHPWFILSPQNKNERLRSFSIGLHLFLKVGLNCTLHLWFFPSLKPWSTHCSQTWQNIWTKTIRKNKSKLSKEPPWSLVQKTIRSKFNNCYFNTRYFLFFVISRYHDSFEGRH